MIELPKLSFSKVLSINDYTDIPSNISGIYFIFDESQLLVYVGQAKSIRARMLQHAQAKNGEV